MHQTQRQRFSYGAPPFADTATDRAASSWAGWRPGGGAPRPLSGGSKPAPALPHAQRQRRNKTVARQTDATKLINLCVLQQQLFDVQEALDGVSSELAHAERRLIVLLSESLPREPGERASRSVNL